jgi:hypothetical protein
MNTWVKAQFASGLATIDEILTVRLGASSIELSSEGGDATIDDASLVSSVLELSLWLHTGNRVVVVTSRSAACVYRVSLSDMGVQELDLMFRGEDDDLRHLTARAATDGSLLLLYERGLMCLNSDGFVRWHRLHDDISARFVDVDSKRVWLESQWPQDVAGRRTGYDLESGQESSS